MNSNVKKLTLAGLLIALGVACSTFAIPIGASRCFPIQHMVIVLAAVLLGPAYGVGICIHKHHLASSVRKLFETHTKFLRSIAKPDVWTVRRAPPSFAFFRAVK